MEEDEQIQHGARNDREEHGKRDIAAAAGETHGHGNEDDGDVFGVTGCGAETDKAERAGDRDARADVAVDEHNDGLHGKRQQNDSEHKALRKARAARIRKRDECAAKQRDERANQNEDTVIPDEVKLANMVSMGISFLESNELFRMHARCACRGCYRRWHI